MDDYFLPISIIISIYFSLLIIIKGFKKKREFEKSLKVGNKIVTESGVHGIIFELKKTTAIIETASGKLKIDLDTISVDLTLRLQKQ